MADTDFREAGRRDLEDILRRYEDAVAESRRRANFHGAISSFIGVNDPQAAAAYLNAYKNYINEPIASIVGALEAEGRGLDINKEVLAQRAIDEDNDPASSSSLAARQIVRKYGIDVPETATAAMLKRILPYASLEIKGQQKDIQQERELGFRAEEGEKERGFKGEESEKQRKFMASEGAKNRAAAQQRVETAGKYGLGRTIISGTFGQQKAEASGSGVSGSAQRAADTMTHAVPRQFSGLFGGKKFLVRKEGLGAIPRESDALTKSLLEATKYDIALERLESLYKEIKSDTGMAPQIFAAKWPEIQSAFSNAVQDNIKYKGNGVANGPDIEQAVKQIGELGPTGDGLSGFISWMRGGGLRKTVESRKSLAKTLSGEVDALGYEPSDKPHPLTRAVGSGGQSTSSRRAPINPAATEAANAIAKEAGWPEPFSAGGRAGAGAPQYGAKESAKERLLKKLGVK